MGEAKNSTAAILRAQPGCTYCGDINASTSRDHCPPTAIFNDRWRPAGLEFGVCRECHEGTREMDAIVAMLSRNFPDPSTPMERAEGRHHTSHFVRRYPHLAGLLQFDDNPVLYQGQLAHAVAIPAGSRLVRVLIAFAARVGLALYRHQFGHPAPPSTAIHASWHPNAHLDDDNEMEELLQSMGQARTLVQGHREVFEQFRYWSATAADVADLYCCFAAFRKSFGVLAVIDPAGAHYPDNEYEFSPGFLQGFQV